VAEIRILDVLDEPDLARLPPCADPRFDHRTCDYWEDADRGSKQARPALLRPVPRPDPTSTRRPSVSADNPFAPSPGEGDWNPFAPRPSDAGTDPFAVAAAPTRPHAAAPTDPIAAAAAAETDPFGADDLFATPEVNPFAPAPPVGRRPRAGLPRKLALLDRGRGVFGSYAKVLLEGEVSLGYAQFGPLSAYPRALRQRELYPQLPDSPLPAVITCIATTAEARRRGLAIRLVESVCDDLADRGFAAVEAYPDVSLPPDATSAAFPPFWERCGFRVVVRDERYPLVRRELG
jgi:hypothetical protein